LADDISGLPRLELDGDRPVFSPRGEDFICVEPMLHRARSRLRSALEQHLP